MSNAMIYATGNHKGKEEKGYFAFSIYKKSGKKPTDQVGEFESETKTSTHLTILIRSIKQAKETVSAEEYTLVSDFPLVKKFMDGSIEELESNDWKKGPRTIPFAAMWAELYTLTQEYNVVYKEAEKDDDKMKYLSKIMKNEKKGVEKGKIASRLPKSGAVLKTDFLFEAKGENWESPVGSEESPVALESHEEETTPISFDLIKNRVLGSTLTNVDLVGKVMEPDHSSIKIDPKLRRECETLFDEIGMELDVAINVFLKHCIRNQGFTFDLRLKEEKEEK